jgi:hypothetical protein
MCPVCIATATQIATGATSGAAFIVQIVRTLRTSDPKLFEPKQENRQEK